MCKKKKITELQNVITKLISKKAVKLNFVNTLTKILLSINTTVLFSAFNIYSFHFMLSLYWPALKDLFGHLGQRIQAVNTTLTYHHVLSWYGELPIYTSSTHGAALAIIWNRVSGHMMNVSSMFTQF